ncbi:MAG: dihydroneopterin aldolase [Spirochaetota bacterium]
MSTLFINDLCVKAHIGVYEKERRNKQPLLISVEVEHEIDYENFKDSIDETIDYSSLRKEIKNIARTSKFNLIESFALKIARLLKENYRVRSVSVTIKKFPYGDAAFVGCRVSL